jgi:acetylornithine deacetylase/succinyl-diaminopimelate desuccinylase-like protein
MGAPPLGAILGDLTALARIPAPTFREADRIDWIERRLSGAAGIVARDGVGNLVWGWGEGRPRLLLAVHVDTVFDGTVPHAVERRGETLVGPGVGDNAAAVAVAINVVENVLAGGVLAPGAVAFTVCEEGLGNLRGAAAACDALAPEAFVALEGHLLDRVLVDAVGSVRARVEIAGPGGHPWVDRGRPSAVHELLRVGTRLADLAGEELAVNVGVASGGRAVNSIADRAELLFEARAVNGPLLDAVERELGRLAPPPPLSATVEILGRRPGGRLDRSAPLLAAVRGVRAELGLPDLLDAGSTDANAALARGIPALALGVARGADMHTPTEQIEIPSLALGYRQVERLLVRLLG